MSITDRDSNLIFFANGKVAGSLTFIKTGPDAFEPWDGSISVSTSGGPITDGVDTDIKATVIDFITGDPLKVNPLSVILTDTNGDPYNAAGGGGGGAVTIADGADVVEGELADAAVTGDSAGTVSAKLRGINLILADVWSNADNWLRVRVDSSALPTGASTLAEQQSQTTLLTTISGKDFATQTTLAALNAKFGSLGQAAMAASAPVVIASNQSTLPVVGTGTAGSPGTAVLTIQGIGSGTAVPVSGTVAVTGVATLAEQQTQTAHLASIVTAVQIMDDWDESDRAKVNVIVGQAGITAGAGSVAANTPRVTHASDDPVTTAVQIMDDWDESDRAKVNPIVGQAGVAANAGANSATTQRVTVATDDSLNTGASTMNASGGDGSTALTNSAQAIKASAGRLLGWNIYNPNNEVSYVQIYNTASGSVTVGTTNPLFTIAIPPTSAEVMPISVKGIAFSTAISWAATTTAGGNTAPTTALVATAFYV